MTTSGCLWAQWIFILDLNCSEQTMNSAVYRSRVAQSSRSCSVAYHHVMISSVDLRLCILAALLFWNGNVITMHSQILRLPLRAPIQRLPIAARLPIRHASTAAPQTPSGRSRWTRRLIYASIFGTLGVAAGGVLDSKISPPPQPGSPMDRIYMEEIQAVYEGGLPIVQELRHNPDWEESGVYQGMPAESKAHRLTSSALAGSRGIALQVSCHGCQHTRLASCKGTAAPTYQK